jgi:hypothetical protein
MPIKASIDTHMTHPRAASVDICLLDRGCWHLCICPVTEAGRRYEGGNCTHLPLPYQARTLLGCARWNARASLSDKQVLQGHEQFPRRRLQKVAYGLKGASVLQIEHSFQTHEIQKCATLKYVK